MFPDIPQYVHPPHISLVYADHYFTTETIYITTFYEQEIFQQRLTRS